MNETETKTRWQKAQAVAYETQKRLSWLMNMTNEAQQRAELAKLRRGIGHPPGELPELWSILLDNLPDTMRSDRDEPTHEEWAIYTSLTMFALHQQGRDIRQEPMHESQISLGNAAWQLTEGKEEERSRVARRFNQVALADSMEEMNYYLRGFVQLLKAKHIPLDYAMLAHDLYIYQYEDLASAVRLKWGQDFYTIAKGEAHEEEDANHA